MKHIKHLFAVCLLLLIATTATAQSQSDNTQTKAVSATKADVNGDGVVNEADIEEIIEIMKKDNGVKYYWYAGQTKPTSMTSDPTPDDTTTPPTNNNWHTLAKDATSIAKTVVGGTSGIEWYVAVPTSFGFKPTASDLKSPDNSWTIIGTITVGPVEYTLWQPAATSSRCAAYMAKI